MLEILSASLIVGSVQIAPNTTQIDYLTPNHKIVSVLQNSNDGGDRWIVAPGF